MVNRRAFVALAACGACAAIGGIAGCGPKSQEPTGSVPADAVSTWAIEAVAEDDNPVGTVQRDSWKLQDDGSVLLTVWGSSNPRPEPESAELDGRVLAVQLKPYDGPATMDLVPSLYALTPPDGSDGPEAVTVDYADGADPVELPRAED